MTRWLLALLLVGCATTSAADLERRCREQGAAWHVVYDAHGDVKAYTCSHPAYSAPPMKDRPQPKGAL